MPTIPYRFASSGAKDVENDFLSIERRAAAADRAARAWGRSTEASAKAASRAADKAGKQLGPTRQTMYRAQVRAEEDMAKAHARAVATRERVDLASQRRLTRVREQAQAQQLRHQRQQLSQLAQQSRAEERVHRAHRQAMLTGALGGAARWGIRGVGAVGAGGMAVGGMALRQGLELQEMAASLSVRARMPGQKAIDPSILRTEFETAAAGAPGVKATDIAAGVQQIVTRTGQLELARSWEGTMATIVSATDVQGAALGDAMATLMQKFDVKTVGQMQQAMADLTFQGKKGAFELTDMAQYLMEVGASAERFGGFKSARGVKVIGGMMQIARQSTGSGAEAATAVENMFRVLVAASGEIKKKTGYEVFKDKGKTQTKDFMEVIPGIIAGAKGNQAKLQEIFDIRGIRAISPLIAVYNEQVRSGKSQAQAMQSVTDVMLEAMDSGATWADMQRDAAIRAETPQARMRHAWEVTAATLTGKLLPAAAALAGQFATWLSRDDVQLALGKLAETIVGGAEVVADIFGWMFDRAVDLGLVSPEEVSQQKAGKAVKEAEAAVMAFRPTDKAGREQFKGYIETLKSIGKSQAKNVESLDPLIRPIVLAEMAQRTGVPEDLAKAYYRGGEISRAAKAIMYAELEPPATTAEEGGAGIGGKIGNILLPGALGTAIGEYAGGQIGRGVGNLQYDPNAPRGGEKPLKLEQAVAQLDSLTSAAERAAKAMNGVEAKPSVFGSLW